LCQRGDLVSDHHVDLTGHQILRGRGATAIMHELKAGTRGVLEKNAEDVLWATHAGGPGRYLVRVSLQPSDETFQVMRRHGLLCDDQR